MLKYLLLILVIAGVWYGFRYVNRKKAVGDKPAADTVDSQPRRPVTAEDMVACSVCGIYVAPGAAKSCGQQNCPYPSA
ncbi:hypothetical protein [uncultured Ferrovibrio sp.]|jgi:hypothetical protein|uniref:hypothetical protein n=1 Tax=uncultured Ferrovibrio sp. TaxID=1576913 RepID=UPI002613D6EE|nr:hypothetical protein [uncultured Ferrovibrio sp.]